MAGQKRKKLRRFETLLWMVIKGIIYVGIMIIFMGIMSIENFALHNLSRTLGIVTITYMVVGALFITIYGRYDVGRRKSKPIAISLALATLFTDLITYVELMVMNTITPSIYAFRFSSVGFLFISYLVQVLFILMVCYAGNGLFFLLHRPEKSCVVTSSQESLDAIIRGIHRYKKQYRVRKVFDFRDKNLLSKLDDFETVFIYDVPIPLRSEIVRYCYNERKNVYFNPEVQDIVEKSSEYYLLDDISMLNYQAKGLTMGQRIMKRLMDICLSILIGILSSPIWIIAAIVIKCYDGGHVLYSQNRATINGKIFRIYKFRTMKEHVEHRSAEKDDDRITKPGKFFRKTRIDELPQLINILKGEMSFVGPRAEMVENVYTYTEQLPEFRYRLRVKAGLTGYAQISGKYNTTPKDKLMMDMMYIENYSIMKDIQLLFQTAVVLLKSDSTEGFQVGEGEQVLQFVPAKPEDMQ